MTLTEGEKWGKSPCMLQSDVCKVTFENVYADECAGNAHASGGGEKVRHYKYVICNVSVSVSVSVSVL